MLRIKKLYYRCKYKILVIILLYLFSHLCLYLGYLCNFNNISKPARCFFRLWGSQAINGKKLPYCRIFSLFVLFLLQTMIVILPYFLCILLGIIRFYLSKQYCGSIVLFLCFAVHIFTQQYNFIDICYYFLVCNFNQISAWDLAQVQFSRELYYFFNIIEIRYPRFVLPFHIILQHQLINLHDFLHFFPIIIHFAIHFLFTGE